jgi:enamine deaminase RidA (YjgF/YER057c/UK114 family)
MMAATAAAMGGSAAFGAPVPQQGRGGRPPHPRPAGIVWIPGIGIGPQKASAWNIRDHTRLTMDNIKARVEQLGGTMSDFLYMQVFFCLHLDDNSPMPTGSAAFAAYQQGYQDLNSVYNTYWKDTTHGAPPRSCFALAWIPGNSLIEIVGAAHIPSAATPSA